MRRTLMIVVAILLPGACSGDDDDAGPTTTAQDEGDSPETRQLGVRPAATCPEAAGA